MSNTEMMLQALLDKYRDEKKQLEQHSNPREAGYRNGMNRGSVNTLDCVIRDIENILEGN